MWASAVVMRHPRLERLAQMCFREWNEPVQTLSPKGPDDALTERVGNSSQLHVIRPMKRNLSG